MSVHTKKRKSLEKANTMMGFIDVPADPIDSYESPEGIFLTKPPRLNENSLNFLNDVESVRSGRSGSQKRTRKEGSLLDHIKLPEPSVKLTSREYSDDNKSERSKKSKKNTKDGVLMNPGNMLIGFAIPDQRDSSFEKVSERSNSKSQKRKTVKQNSLVDFKNKQSFGEMGYGNYKRADLSPMPSSLVEYSSAPSDLPQGLQVDPYKPLVMQTQRTNNLVRIPQEQNEQKIGTPYNPASRTTKPVAEKVSNNFSNASSILQLSSQLLESSKNRGSRQRKKIFTKTSDQSRVQKVQGDQDFQFSDSDEGDHKASRGRENHQLKITQLKYSSTPPKNQEVKNDSVMFNFQQEVDTSHNYSNNIPVKEKKKGLNLLAREPSEDSSFDNNRSREISREKKKRSKDSDLLPETKNKFFDLSAPKSPYKPNDSFYEEQPVPVQSQQAMRIISFDDDNQDFRSNTIGGQRGFIEKIPSMTGDNFMINSDVKFDQSISSLKYPKSKPPRSVSSKRSNNSEKSSSLMDSGVSSHRDAKKVTLSELASQKMSQVSKGKSKDKKKDSSLLEFYENSSQDNRSNASKDSKRGGKKESSLIDMNRFAKKGSDQFQGAGYNTPNFSHPDPNDIPQITMKENPKKKNKEMSIRELQEVESRVITKNCYVLDERGKVVKKNCVLQLSGRSRSKERQPNFYETDFGQNYIKSTGIQSRKSSEEKHRGHINSRQRSKERDRGGSGYGYRDEESRNRNRSREKSGNFQDSSLSEFYRPRQEMKQAEMRTDDFYLKHYYNGNEDRSYTYEYYGDSEEQEVERVSFNAMFSKNTQNNSNRLPRTQTSASKRGNRNR